MHGIRLTRQQHQLLRRNTAAAWWRQALTPGACTCVCTAVSLGVLKVNLGFVGALARGMLCNWLVCLAVWLATAAQVSIP